jgi:arabinose-5-phosphate isomerase
VTEQDKWRAEGQRVLWEAARALDRLAERLDGEVWAQAVHLILQTKGRVVVTGMGKSGTIGVKLAATLSSTGTPAQFLHPADGVHGDLGMLQPGDTVIAFSYSGETDEVLAILPALGPLGLPLIAVTGNSQSTLGRAAALALDVRVEREACSIGLAPTTSTTAMIALGDALAVSVMAAREFTPEQYSRLHPAGTLGRRLTLRVADVMRTGDAVAVVPESCTVLEAMFAITKAHAGAAIIVNNDGLVVGLLTDGDIRRHLLDNQHLLTLPASEAMTPSPGTVTPDLLATEGLRRLDDFHPLPGQKAGDAPVVDPEGRPIGMLTLKDLVKAGIT